jgi:hypothetical protein
VTEIKTNGLQRKTDGGNGDRRVSEKEELIDTWDYDGPSETKYPSTECRHKHGWVIRIGNRGADFRVGRLIFEFGGHRVEIWVVIVFYGDVLGKLGQWMRESEEGRELTSACKRCPDSCFSKSTILFSSSICDIAELAGGGTASTLFWDKAKGGYPVG